MGTFDPREFSRFILENRVVGFFEREVTLKSGRKSNWYVNWRTVAADAFLTDRLSDFLIAFTSDLGIEPDAFFGVPEGATKLAVIATYKWARSSPSFAPGSNPLPMGRGRPKEHGDPKDRYFVGEPRGRTVVVEDVTTTGGSLLAALDQLSEAGAEVVAAIGLTNRMERRDDGRGVADAVAERGIAYRALSDATDFLPAAYRAFAPGEAIGRAIEGEFRRWGVKPLKLLA